MTLEHSRTFMRKGALILASVGLALLLLSLMWFSQRVSADPTNARLVVHTSDTQVITGDTYIVKVTLDQLDAADVFDTWNIELSYNATALQLNKIWVNDAIVPAGTQPFTATGADWVLFGDGASSGDSGSKVPFHLGTLTFTAATAGAANIRVLSDTLNPENSTSFGLNSAYWIPGQTDVKLMLQDIALSGPTNGITATAYTFTATVNPLTVTTPITYVWQASEHNSLTQTSGLSDTAVFSWTTPGRHVLTATALNSGGIVTTTHTITVEQPIVPVDTIGISGLSTGLVGAAYTFTAMAGPPTATVPLTYHWQAPTVPAVLTHTSTLSDTAIFSWTTPGVHVLTVTAFNASGLVTATHTITIAKPGVAVDAVSLSGPLTGLINTTYTFTAIAGPLTATLPITYHWQAIDQAAITHTGGLSDTAVFGWTTPGRHVLTATAFNSDGIVTTTHTITVTPATHWVITDTDAGAGSLRQALLAAQAYDTIRFDTTVFPPTSPMTITVLSALPILTQGHLMIDASDAGVVLDGQQLSADSDGLHIASDSNVVKGLKIINFPNNGIEITGGAKYNRIGGDWMVGDAPHGEGNILTLNGNDGVDIHGAGTMSNTVSGNLIGLDVAGTRDFRVQAIAFSPVYTQDHTVFIGTRYDGVWKTTDGGETWAAVNNGLTLSNVLELAISPAYGSDQTLFIGSEQGAVFKSTNGGISWLRVDGDAVGERRVQAIAISPDYANDGEVFVVDDDEGVFVSTDRGSTWQSRNEGLSGYEWGLMGLHLSPDYASDQTLFAFSWDKLFKSTDQGHSWITVTSELTSLSTLAFSPNYAVDQTIFLGVGHCEAESLPVFWKSIDQGVHWTPISGASGMCGVHAMQIVPNYPMSRTLFAGDAWGGVYRSTDDGANWLRVKSSRFNWALAISPGYAQDQTVFVGQHTGDIFRSTDKGDTWTQLGARFSKHGNYDEGVHIWEGAQWNVIGGESAGERNIISNNGVRGMAIQGSDTCHNQIIGNYIGTDAEGTGPQGNDVEGVVIEMGARFNLLHDNVIAGNGTAGIHIRGTGTMSNTVTGNYVGVDTSGAGPLGNGNEGIVLKQGTQGNQIGGALSEDRNVISSNGNSGIIIFHPETDRNTVSGNYIGVGVNGVLPLGNYANGIEIGNGEIYEQNGPYENRVGGATSDERNVISANGGHGIGIGYSARNIVVGNYIGVDVTGIVPLGNQHSGIGLYSEARENRIGGTTPGEYNVIGDNHWDGVTFWTRATGNTIAGNYIGTDADGTMDLGNHSHGIGFYSGAHSNVVGSENVIVHNWGSGVRITGSDTRYNTITQNSIYENGGLGINNISGGNEELSSPIITGVTADTIWGIAPKAYSTIEVFSDDEDEGRAYEGRITADANGHFTFTQQSGFDGPNITATAIDSQGNTSEFSAPILLIPIKVTLDGPTTGMINESIIFIATVDPVVTTSITYLWQFDDSASQQTITHTGGISDTVVISWSVAGTHIVTVTVTNTGGSTQDTHTFQAMGNLPPMISDLSIIPSSPTSDDNLGVDYDYSDPEDDPPGNMCIRWTRDGQLQSAFNNQKEISSSVTFNCEIWCVTVTPHDGYSYGSPVKQCVNVGGCNTPPQALNVAIDPANPSAPDGETVILPAPQGITVTYKFTDTDGDLENEPLGQTRWYRNEKLQPAFNDQESVSLDEIHPGELWHAEVRVHDGQSYGDFIASEPVIIANADTGNHIPEILTATLTPVAPETNATLVLSYTYSDEDGDEEGVSLVRWYRNDKVQPGYNGAITIPAQSTLPGEEWYAAIRPHDGMDYGVAFETNIVQIHEPTVNTEPEIIEAHITPAKPGDDDFLRLHYTYRDVDGDPEGDTLILWYKVGLEDIKLQEDYIGLTVIPSTTTKNGETWFAKVVPHDGHEYGLVVAARSVVVGVEESNIPPRARNVYLTPERPSLQDRLELNYEFVDANGDSEEATVISWILNGYPGGYEGRTIIPAYATAVGQTWCATVTPHDGREHGELVESNCVTITEEFKNAPPEAQNPYIMPGRPGSDQDFTLDYTYFDPDGDEEGNSEILWYRNNVPQKNFEGQTSVPADSTNPGEQWYATIRPHDGEKYGALTTTTVIRINHPPEISEVKILPQAPNESDTLTVTYTYSDKDNDLQDWPEVQWYCNGEPQPDYDGMRVLPARATLVGEVWYAKVSAFDGIEYSSELASAVVSIARDPRRFIYLPAIMRDYPLPSLTLTRPIGNESWQGGSSQAIRWVTTGNVPNVSLSYSPDGFFTSSPIAHDVPNSGSYLWTVPNISTPCAKVRIVSPDDPLEIRDTSGCVELTETFVSPAITLTQPTGGENWVMDKQHKITWDHAGGISRVNLTYSTDDFVTEEVIASEVPNTGSYVWKLPSRPTAVAKVRISSVGNSSVRDTSDFFVIGCDGSWEDNDEPARACPLDFGTTHSAYPDDKDDWYYVFLSRDASLSVLVDNYQANGQLVVYLYNADVNPPRGETLANDGRGRTRMELPNVDRPHALDHLPGQPFGSGLPPGRYFIRIYTSGAYNSQFLYHLVTEQELVGR